MVYATLTVAPHAGAWIETPNPSPRSAPIESPLTQGRGLKLGLPCQAHSQRQVAPHAGAWIETSRAE